MSKINVGTLEVVITHEPEHFNRICQATIPESWNAEVVDMPKALLDKFHADNIHSHLHIYGVSETRQGAIQDIVDFLKNSDVTGKLHIVNA